jgi:hypothetical protein
VAVVGQLGRRRGRLDPALLAALVEDAVPVGDLVRAAHLPPGQANLVEVTLPPTPRWRAPRPLAAAARRLRAGGDPARRARDRAAGRRRAEPVAELLFVATAAVEEQFRTALTA